MTVVRWTEQEVASMSIDRCRALRAEIASTLVASDDSSLHRRDTFNMLRALDQRIASASPASIEERAASAKSFLHPSNNGARERAFAMATELYGSEREAIRRGHRKPA